MSQPPPSGNSRSISLSGLLAAMAGIGQFFAYFKFRDQTRAWGDLETYGFFAIAFCLTLWGVKQLVAGWQERSGLPRARRKQKYRVNLPLEGVVYLVIMSVMFIGSMLGRSNMLLLVFSLMAGAFVINGFISFNLLRKLQVKRQLPPVVTVGEPFNVYLDVQNRKRMAVWVLGVHDTVENDRESMRATVVFTRIAGHGSQIGQYRLQLMQRGRYRLGPVQISTRFPLGIVERSATLQEVEEILVCPRPGRLLATRTQQRRSDELVYRHESRAGVYDDEFHRIREYRSGDNPRAIHWRSTARRNELMVREYHESRDENLMVLLDLWLPRTPTLEQVECVETAISFAATVCQSHMQQVRSADICAGAMGDGFASWSGTSGHGSWESLLKFLAGVTAGPEEGLDELQTFWRTKRAPDVRAVLITTRTLDEFSDQLGQLPEELQSGSGGNFFQEVLMYSAVGGALDSVFVPPQELVAYETVPRAGGLLRRGTGAGRGRPSTDEGG